MNIFSLTILPSLFLPGSKPFCVTRRVLLLLLISSMLLCVSSGLQASPSKHTGYSVRMENAVPIVTQAPGAQPLQIQPGLLTQVGSSDAARRRGDQGAHI